MRESDKLRAVARSAEIVMNRHSGEDVGAMPAYVTSACLMLREAAKALEGSGRDLEILKGQATLGTKGIAGRKK